VSREEWAEIRKKEKKRLGRQRRMGGPGSEGRRWRWRFGKKFGVWERECRERGMIRADFCDGICEI